MTDLWQATQQALQLLLTGNAELWHIIGISFSVSLRAVAIATPVAFVVAFLLSYTRFPGRALLVSMFNTMLSIPAVVVGLLLYLLLSRSGPMGDLHLLFTQKAMVIGQIVLCFPLLVAMGYATIAAADRRIWETAITLGARRGRAFLTLLHEVRFGLIATAIAGFGRIISEVGTSMMVGGNILGYTRNVPTAIALETAKGSFAQGIALGLVLISLAFALNLTVAFFNRRMEPQT